MDRKYEISITPPAVPFGTTLYSIDLIPLPTWEGPIPENTFNRAELTNALRRLGIEGAALTEVCEVLDRGDIFRIVGASVADDVAATFGWAF